MRILFVDDGEANRELAQLVLSHAGAEVDTAENGKQAVERALVDDYDVVLMDMQMPVMDGYTAASTLRSQGYTKPIVALTAHAMHGDEHKCRQAGCTGFLTKPINMDRLLATISEILDPCDAAAKNMRLQDRKVRTDAKVPEVSTECQEAPPALDVETASASGNTDPVRKSETPSSIRSSLPMEDPRFRKIVEKFVHRLFDQLSAMRQAWKSGDLDKLADLAHWLKGSGGTVGFDAFTQPARALEQAARSGAGDEIGTLIVELQEIAERIDTSPEAMVCGLV